ncbi:GIY-YIG nuclease family protein [Patescibacteria group bacterium]|nr:GIY-YIG nuclease family protein [Patescibacteria group bacterium]
MNNLNYFVYIMTNKRNGTLYIGVTNDLKRRVYEHKEKLAGGFTKNYNLKNLVYYELHNNPKAAIKREKQLKEWKRLWKLKLIEEKNPEWIDLYYEI